MANILFEGLALHGRLAPGSLSYELVKQEWAKYQATQVRPLSSGRWSVEHGMIPALCWNNSSIFITALPNSSDRERLVELVRRAKINLDNSQVVDLMGQQISSMVLNASPF